MNKAIKELVMFDDLRYDPWGTAMSHHFAICEVLYHDDIHVPSEWEYRHGMGHDQLDQDIDGEDCTAMDYVYMLSNGTVTHDDLIHAGNVLSRYERLLEHLGRSY
jgi:hypothetical protein